MTPIHTPTGDPLARALAAWYREGNTDLPSVFSGVTEHDDKSYVVLTGSDGILAVYRITNAGQLKRLKRWPTEVEEGFK